MKDRLWEERSVGTAFPSCFIASRHGQSKTGLFDRPKERSTFQPWSWQLGLTSLLACMSANQRLPVLDTLFYIASELGTNKNQGKSNLAKCTFLSSCAASAAVDLQTCKLERRPGFSSRQAKEKLQSSRYSPPHLPQVSEIWRDALCTAQASNTALAGVWARDRAEVQGRADGNLAVVPRQQHALQDARTQLSVASSSRKEHFRGDTAVDFYSMNESDTCLSYNRKLLGKPENLFFFPSCTWLQTELFQVELPKPSNWHPCAIESQHAI